MSDVVLERAPRAAARGRAFGQSFYGQCIGADGRAAAGTATLGIPGEPPGVGAPTVSVVALAVFVDLALGGATSWTCAGRHVVVRGGQSAVPHDEDAETLAKALPRGAWVRIERPDIPSRVISRRHWSRP
jgi:hypothetical protein